jgi:hypothetical protein
MQVDPEHLRVKALEHRVSRRRLAVEEHTLVEDPDQHMRRHR